MHSTRKLEIVLVQTPERLSPPKPTPTQNCSAGKPNLTLCRKEPVLKPLRLCSLSTPLQQLGGLLATVTEFTLHFLAFPSTTGLSFAAQKCSFCNLTASVPVKSQFKISETEVYFSISPDFLQHFRNKELSQTRASKNFTMAVRVGTSVLAHSSLPS